MYPYCIMGIYAYRIRCVVPESVHRGSHRVPLSMRDKTPVSSW